MKRAVSISQLLTTEFNVIDFEGQWEDLIGKPELAGTWIIFGKSGNGKTRFTLQLCKYLTQFGRVAYDSLEEGVSLSMRMAMVEVGMESVKKNIVLLDQEPISDLIIRLKKRKSPNIIVIDSVQYTGMSYDDYKQLRKLFPNKLFILISHAEGKEPAGRVAKSIRYDSFVKIWIEGFKAFALSRYGGGQPFTIWEKGAKEYWATVK